MSAGAQPYNGPRVEANLRRVEGDRRIHPARVVVDGETYLLHGDGTVYTVRVARIPVVGKPGYVEEKETIRRVKDHGIIAAVQRAYDQGTRHRTNDQPTNTRSTP